MVERTNPAIFQHQSPRVHRDELTTNRSLKGSKRNLSSSGHEKRNENQIRPTYSPNKSPIQRSADSSSRPMSQKNQLGLQRIRRNQHPRRWSTHANFPHQRSASPKAKSDFHIDTPKALSSHQSLGNEPHQSTSSSKNLNREKKRLVNRHNCVDTEEVSPRYIVESPKTPSSRRLQRNSDHSARNQGSKRTKSTNGSRSDPPVTDTDKGKEGLVSEIHHPKASSSRRRGTDGIDSLKIPSSHRRSSRRLSNNSDNEKVTHENDRPGDQHKIETERVEKGNVGPGSRRSSSQQLKRIGIDGSSRHCSKSPSLRRMQSMTTRRESRTDPQEIGVGQIAKELLDSIDLPETPSSHGRSPSSRSLSYSTGRRRKMSVDHQRSRCYSNPSNESVKPVMESRGDVHKIETEMVEEDLTAPDLNGIDAEKTRAGSIHSLQTPSSHRRHFRAGQGSRRHIYSSPKGRLGMSRRHSCSSSDLPKLDFDQESCGSSDNPCNESPTPENDRGSPTEVDEKKEEILLDSMHSQKTPLSHRQKSVVGRRSRRHSISSTVRRNFSIDEALRGQDDSGNESATHDNESEVNTTQKIDKKKVKERLLHDIGTVKSPSSDRRKPSGDGDDEEESHGHSDSGSDSSKPVNKNLRSHFERKESIHVSQEATSQSDANPADLQASSTKSCEDKQPVFLQLTVEGDVEQIEIASHFDNGTWKETASPSKRKKRVTSSPANSVCDDSTTNVSNRTDRTSEEERRWGDYMGGLVAKLDALYLTYPGWQDDHQKAENALEQGDALELERCIQTLKNRQSVADGDRSHPHLVALDAAKFSYPESECDVWDLEQLHMTLLDCEAHQFWEKLEFLKSKEQASLNLAKVDALNVRQARNKLMEIVGKFSKPATGMKRFKSQ